MILSDSTWRPHSTRSALSCVELPARTRASSPCRLCVRCAQLRARLHDVPLQSSPAEDSPGGGPGSKEGARGSAVGQREVAPLDVLIILCRDYFRCAPDAAAAS